MYHSLTDAECYLYKSLYSYTSLVITINDTRQLIINLINCMYPSLTDAECYLYVDNYATELKCLTRSKWVSNRSCTATEILSAINV